MSATAVTTVTTHAANQAANHVPNSAHDAVPPPVRSLSDLFGEALAAVKFPDVDAPALAAGVAKVDGLQAEVMRLEEELGRARAALDVGRDELLRMAARAHAYARVYAEDDDALRSRIDAITLPRARARPASVVAVAGEGAGSAPRRKKRAVAEEEPSSLFGGSGEGSGESEIAAAAE